MSCGSNSYANFLPVQTLFASENASYVIAEALKCVNWEMISEVLPALDLLRLEELHVSYIQTFVAEHFYEDHPVIFVNTKRGFKKDSTNTYRIHWKTPA